MAHQCFYCGRQIALHERAYHYGKSVSKHNRDEWRCHTCHESIEQGKQPTPKESEGV